MKQIKTILIAIVLLFTFSCFVFSANEACAYYRSFSQGHNFKHHFHSGLRMHHNHHSCRCVRGCRHVSCR